MSSAVDPANKSLCTLPWLSILCAAGESMIKVEVESSKESERL